MATRLVAGTLREIWRETTPLVGGGSQVITTGIRATDSVLSNVFGILRVSPVGGSAILEAVPSVIGGHMAVTVSNISANPANWTLDVTLTHSVQQARELGAVGIIHTLAEGGSGGASTPVLQNIAALRAFTDTPLCVDVLGYYAPGDGGGGTFIWNGTSAAADDAGLVIRPASMPPVGRWIRSYDDFITVRYFGAKGDGVTDDCAAIQAALNSNVGEVYIPPTSSVYMLDDELTVPNNTKVVGAGWMSKVQQRTIEKNVFISGSQCVFDSLHLIGHNLDHIASFEKNNGIFATSQFNVTVSNCFIEKCSAGGVNFQFTRDAKLLNNYLFSNRNAGGGSHSDIILGSSGRGFGRVIITGNHCFSNNSQGMFVDGLGGDSDLLIEANICITLDPTTCVEGGSWSEQSAAGLARRHGIVVNYAPALDASPRCVVNGNLCHNTLWTGIYKAGISRGPVSIIGNICSYNGYENNTLCGGIFVNQSGGESIVGNAIFDFQATTTGTGGIVLVGGQLVPDDDGSLVSENVIRGSLSSGIFLGIASRRARVLDNTISDCANICISVILNSGGADYGNSTLDGNHMYQKTPRMPAIQIDLQDSTLPFFICNNRVYGFDNTTVDDNNCGIVYRGANDRVQVYNNNVSGFYYGITCSGAWPAGRAASVILEGNILSNCGMGFVVAGYNNDAMVPLVDNVFRNTPIPVGTNADIGGFVVGYLCTREGGRFVGEQAAAAPASGTWALGDRVNYTAPVAGGYIGSVCVGGGAPGVWKSFGAIAP